MKPKNTRIFKTMSGQINKVVNNPGSAAFAECETAAITDLFYQFARKRDKSGNKCRCNVIKW